jgi:hypothetical protein
MEGTDNPDGESTEAAALTEDEIAALIKSFFDRPIEAIWRAEANSPNVHRTGLSAEELRLSLAEIIEEVTGIESSEVTVEKVLIEGLVGLRTVGDAVTYLQRTQTRL